MVAAFLPVGRGLRSSRPLPRLASTPTGRGWVSLETTICPTPLAPLRAQNREIQLIFGSG